MESKPACGWLKLRKRTAECPVLRKVQDAIRDNTWEQLTQDTDPDIKKFVAVKDELSIIDGLLYRGDAIVVPKALQQKVAAKAHNIGHQGETRTKELIKTRFWWSGLGADVQEVVRKCPQCQRITPTHRKEPIKHEPLPDRPFQRIAMDFKGPFDGGKYALVILDLYSRWPEVYMTTSTSFKAIKPHLVSYFARYGTPESVKTDNGPPFQGHEFAAFAKAENFHHRKITPHHPEANGEVENFMKLVKKTILRSHLANLNFMEEVQRVLQAYRNTPHPTTGKAPATLVYRKPSRIGQLDDAASKEKEDIVEEILRQRVQEAKAKNDNRGKANVKEHSFYVGQKVLVDLGGERFEAEPFTVVDIKGSTISAANREGKVVCRDSTKYKAFVEEVQIAVPISHGEVQTQDREPPPRPQTRSRGPVPSLPWVKKPTRF